MNSLAVLIFLLITQLLLVSSNQNEFITNNQEFNLMLMNILDNTENERIEDNNSLVKYLIKMSKQLVVDLNMKNEIIEKKIQECSLNTSLLTNGTKNFNQNRNEIKLLLSTIYQDLKTALLV